MFNNSLQNIKYILFILFYNEYKYLMSPPLLLAINLHLIRENNVVIVSNQMEKQFVFNKITKIIKITIRQNITM